MDILKDIQPELVWKYFKEISSVPRGSGNEKGICDYFENFAKENKLEYVRDKANNILIRKNASEGYEKAGGVILQGHMDMVCEKTPDSSHDFLKDPIKLVVDGDFLTADGTTLGGDDGIAGAMALAVLSDSSAKHPALEVLLTTDEEVGMNGARSFDCSLLKGKYLINLDSEDEGQIYVSCAGGVRTTATYPFPTEAAPADYATFRINVKGLSGGHSGDDINKKRGNANKILVRFLVNEMDRIGLRLVDIQSGGLHNAIPREGHAVCMVANNKVSELKAHLEAFGKDVAEELAVTEQGISITIEEAEAATQVMQTEAMRKMLLSLHAVHNGVFAMSQDIDWLVETSSNLASIHCEGDHVTITTSQRSSVASACLNIASVVRAAFELGGAKVVTNEGYPGWKLNPNSKIVKIAKESYEHLFGKEPKILAIHAGLECGLFSEKYPNLDMVSFGPTLRGVHSPDERLLIPTVQMVWDHLLDILKRV